DNVDEKTPTDNDDLSEETSIDFQDKTPKTSQLFTITDETYSQFFDETAELINPDVTSESILILEGTFNNKSFIFRDVSVTIQGYDAVINEGQIVVQDQASVIIDNLSFINTNLNNTVIFATDGNVLRNSKITKTFTDALAREVYITGNFNLVENNEIDITGPSSGIDYQQQPAISPVSGIAILSSNNTVIFNKISYTDTSTSIYDGSSDLITISGILDDDQQVVPAENNNVTRNNLTAVGNGYLYGLSLGVDSNNNNFTYNNLNIESSYFSYGVNILKVPMTNNGILYNNMTLKSTDTAYGVLANVWGEPEVSNFRINYNKIDVESGNAYGLQIAGSNYGIEIIFKNVNITYNNVTATGTYAMGVGLSMTDNVYLYRNILKIYGQTNETNPNSYDNVPATTAGVFSSNGNYVRVYNEYNYTVVNGPDVVYKDMTNSQIYNGVFLSNNDNFVFENVQNSNITNAKANTTSDYTVDLINSNGNLIKSNTFYALDECGDAAVACDDDSTDNVIELNNPLTTNIEITNEELYVGVENTITAKAIGSDNKAVTGKFVFYIDGEEIATVQGSTATCTYTPTDIGDVELTVEFTNSTTTYKPATVTEDIPVVDNRVVITVSEVTANAGETVTLTATVKDMVGNNINKGKVSFKVNGKTVKDADGKVVYAKVVDGLATVTFEVPDEYAGNSYVITAVFSGAGGFAKEQNTSTLTVNSKEASLEFVDTPTTAKVGQTVTLSVKVTGDISKVVFKLNGKTLKDENGKVIYVKVVDGIASVDYVIPDGTKAKDYTLSAVSCGSNRETVEQTLTITQ
ncbi:MAG: Ig-like domain repeat protein, partial [Methanosphaera sp.]|nr:Ig-like domain repeat protein [Methanosphaera sp.]